jgi:hypothetical protein
MANRIVGIGVGVGVACVATAVALLAAEGAMQLFAGRSFLRGASGVNSPVRLKMLDEERIRAGALTVGPYAADYDPFIATRLKGKFTYKFLDGTANTNERGERVRVGPAETEGGTRVVISGDSVAFGFGVNDDETIAHGVEGALAAAIDNKTPRPIGLTAACPGWSFANSNRYVLNHAHELRPNIVVYVTSDNDLEDSPAILETGHRVTDWDPAVGVLHPHYGINHYYQLMGLRFQKFGNKYSPSDDRYALDTGVTPESKRRYVAMIQQLAETRDRLRAAGSQFAIAVYSQLVFYRRLQQFALERGEKLDFIPLFSGLPVYGQLPGDPHPNARATRAAGIQIASELCARGWVPGADAKKIPAQEADFKNLFFTLPAAAELERERQEWDKIATQQIGAKVDFDDGAGWHQIYAGLAFDGTMGIAANLVLRAPNCSQVALRVDRLDASKVLYPLVLTVHINGEPAGEITIEARRAGEIPQIDRTIAIPEARRADPFFEIALRASNWISQEVEGYTRPASVRFQRIEAMQPSLR